MRSIYVVRWTDHDGHQHDRAFFTRKGAVLFLNYIILDCGFTNGRLKAEKTVP